jgi:hypothetical protein
MRIQRYISQKFCFIRPLWGGNGVGFVKSVRRGFLHYTVRQKRK